MTDAAKPEFPFSVEGFKETFSDVRRLILEEWPKVDATELDNTEGDPAQVLELVTRTTKHSKALVRKHLAEIAEVAGVGASGIEARLIRLLHFLEDKADPVGQEAQRLAGQVRSQGEKVGRQVAGSVQEAGDTMKENIWVSLLAALGLGMVAGLVLGLTRGRLRPPVELEDVVNTTFLQRVAQLLTRVANQYVTNAKNELKGDVVRLFIGFVFLGMTGVFSIHTVIFAHVAFVVALDALGLPLWGVVGFVFFADFFMVFFCMLVARFLLWRPLLPRTRAQIARAWHFLIG